MNLSMLSFSLGKFFSDLWDSIVEFIPRLIEFLAELVNQLYRLIFALFYLVFMGIAIIADAVEKIFKSLAGIDPITMGDQSYGGEGSSSDLVWAFITNNSVQDVFWSIMGLSLVLLIVFTIVALIRSEFTLDLKGSAKGPVFSRAFKSLINLALVPSVALISIMGTNFLTNTIYNLFEGDEITLAGKCFQVGATAANRARLDPEFVTWVTSGDAISGSNPFRGMGEEAMAAAVDDMFVYNKTAPGLTYNHYLFWAKFDNDYHDWFTLYLQYPPDTGKFSIINLQAVNYYYDLMEFQIVLAVGSAIAISWILLTVCLVLIKRVFELTILFLLAPPMTAIAPLDGGQAEKKWRQEFMKRLLSVIATIFAYNMYFLIVPLFEKIKIFSALTSTSATGVGLSTLAEHGNLLDTAGGLLTITFDYFFQIICIFVGLSVVKSASALLSNLLGIEDLVKSGGDAAKKAIEIGSKAVGMAAGIGAAAITGGAAIVGAAGGGLSGAAGFVGNLIGDKKDGLGGQIAGAEADVTKSEQAFTAADNKLQAFTQANGSSIAAIEAKDEADRTKEEKDLLSERDGLVSARDAASTRLAEATRTRDLRKTHHISRQREDSMKATAEGARKAAEDAKRSELVSAGFDMSLKVNQDAVAAAGDAAYQNSFDGSVSKHDKKRRRANPLHNIADVYNSQFGEGRQNFLAKGTKIASSLATGKLEDMPTVFGHDIGGALNKKIGKYWNEENAKKIPFVGAIGGLVNSLSELYGADWKTNKRRMWDTTAAFAGDAGQAVRMIYNPNARADMWESAPEKKKRQARLDNDITMEARSNFDKKQAEANERKATLKEMRRFFATSAGGEFGKRYQNIYDQITGGNLTAAELKMKQAELERLEGKGAGSITQKAEDLYRDMKNGHGGEMAKRYQEFKDEMQQDATNRQYAKEKKDKERVQQAALAAGDKPETKISESSVDQIAKAIANAMGAGNGIRIKEGQRLQIDMSPLTRGFAEMQSAINKLADALKKENS